MRKVRFLKTIKGAIGGNDVRQFVVGQECDVNGVDIDDSLVDVYAERGIVEFIVSPEDLKVISDSAASKEEFEAIKEAEEIEPEPEAMEEKAVTPKIENKAVTNISTETKKQKSKDAA